MPIAAYARRRSLRSRAQQGLVWVAFTATMWGCSKSEPVAPPQSNTAPPASQSSAAAVAPPVETVAEYAPAVVEAPAASVESPPASGRLRPSEEAYSEATRTVADYTAALEAKPHDPELLVRRGHAYFMQGNVTSAWDDYNAALEASPGFGRAYVGRGECEFARGAIENALNEYNQAIRIDPNSAEAYNARGFIHVRLREYPQAILDFQEAIGHDNNQRKISAYHNLGWAYLLAGNYEPAITQLTDALDNGGALPALTLKLCAKAYLGLQQYDEALADLNRSIELNPKDSEAFDRRAHAYYMLGDYDRSDADRLVAAEMNSRMMR